MKRAALLALLAAVAACPSRAPAPARPAPKPPVAEQEVARPELPIDEALIRSSETLARPFHHVAVKDGAEVHLLGTIHLGIDPARLPDSVWGAIDAAPIFAMETDVEDTSTMMGLFREDGTTLDQELGPDYWAKLEVALGREMAAGLKRFKTSVASMMVSVRGMPMTDAMDSALRKRAEKAGARVAFFEEPAFQMAMLDRWMDARSLKAQLDDLEGGERSTKQMLTAYAQGDAAAVETLSVDPAAWEDAGRSPRELERMQDEMLFDRNLAWIPQIERLAAEGKVFVAVGAAHLYGDRGVLALLEDRGWTVTRVSP